MCGCVIACVSVFYKGNIKCTDVMRKIKWWEKEVKKKKKEIVKKIRVRESLIAFFFFSF